MAKTKASKKAAAKKSKPEVAEESGSDIEVIEEIHNEDTASDDASYKGKSSSSTRGRNAKRAGTKVSSKKTKAPTPARSSKRESKSKSYKEDESDSVEEEEELPEKQKEVKEDKKKKPVKKVIELAFSKSEESGKEEEEDDEEKDGTTTEDTEEENLPEIDEQTPEKVTPEKKKQKEKETKKAPGKRGRPSQAKEKGSKAPAPPKKSKQEETTEEEEEEMDSDAEYEVEKILEVKLLKNHKREFLVKWKGFPLSQTTWEPEENLSHAKDLLDVFLAKVDKGDVPRTRRVSTIQSTKSSRGQSETRSSTSSSTAPLTRTREGRVSKSRSRTPRIGSTTSTISNNSSVTSKATDSLKLTSVQESEESDEALPLPKLRTNGDLSLQKFMRESVERKLELLKDKHKQASSTILDSKKEEKENTPSEDQSATTRPGAPAKIRTRFGRLAKTALACGAALSVGAALVFTNPETLNWDQISPHVQNAIEALRVKAFEAKSLGGF